MEFFWWFQIGMWSFIGSVILWLELESRKDRKECLEEEYGDYINYQKEKELEK